MNQVIVNSDFRVTIPKEIRKQYLIRPGQKVTVKADGHMIKVMPASNEGDSYFKRRISRPIVKK